jgi:hypothetical protein
LARGSDPRIRIQAIEALNKLDAAAERARAAKPEMSGEDAVRELLSLGDAGPLIVLGMYQQSVDEYGPRLNLEGLPLFKELAPSLSKKLPELWERLRAQLDYDSRADADRFAAAQGVAIADLVRTSRPPVTVIEGAETDVDG